MGHNDSCEKCTGRLDDSCDERQGIFVCTEIVGHEGKHRACSYEEHPAASWGERVRCSFTFKIRDIVTYQCQGDMGHKGRCWYEPSRDSRTSWSPSTAEIAAELRKIAEGNKKQ